METQRDRAVDAVRAVYCVTQPEHLGRPNTMYPFPQLTQALDEAQNRPPEGRADGSLSDAEWMALAQCRRHLDAFNAAYAAWFRQFGSKG